MSAHPPLPNELLSSLEGVAGFDKTAFSRVHSSNERIHSIRLNPQKVTSLPGAFAGAEKVPWSSDGYYLAQRPSFTFDPLFHAGAYYVQEASGMFLEQALKQTVNLSEPLRVLDLCAAPGGKSTHIRSLISKDSLLVSNEAIKGRVGALQENMMKWGAPGVIITNNDPREIGRLEDYFDVIVVDAPCSGSGLFRRDPEAVGEWSFDSVRSCSLRQQRILADAWPALRKDGLLIYSTCSYSKEEDEDILDWIMGQFRATSLPLAVEKDWNIVGSAGSKGGYGYRFFPDKLKGEGFFIMALRKDEGSVCHYPRKRGSAVERPAKKEEDEARRWIASQTPLHFFKHMEQIGCLPEAFGEDLALLRAHAYIRQAGITVGRSTGNVSKDFIPAHDLALSELIDQHTPALSLSKEEAIKYLRKEDVGLPAGGKVPEKAWVLAQYQGHNLGWVKRLPGRINNYYPKELRILKRD